MIKSLIRLGSSIKDVAESLIILSFLPFGIVIGAIGGLILGFPRLYQNQPQRYVLNLFKHHSAQ